MPAHLRLLEVFFSPATCQVTFVVCGEVAEYRKPKTQTPEATCWMTGANRQVQVDQLSFTPASERKWNCPLFIWSNAIGSLIVFPSFALIWCLYPSPSLADQFIHPSIHLSIDRSIVLSSSWQFNSNNRLESKELKFACGHHDKLMTLNFGSTNTRFQWTILDGQPTKQPIANHHHLPHFIANRVYRHSYQGRCFVSSLNFYAKRAWINGNARALLVRFDFAAGFVLSKFQSSRLVCELVSQKLCCSGLSYSNGNSKSNKSRESRDYNVFTMQ